MLQVFNLPIAIDWRDFKVGTSLFIPCLDRGAVEDWLGQECARLGYKATIKQVIRNRMYGVQVWRVD